MHKKSSGTFSPLHCSLKTLPNSLRIEAVTRILQAQPNQTYHPLLLHSCTHHLRHYIFHDLPLKYKQALDIFTDTDGGSITVFLNFQSSPHHSVTESCNRNFQLNQRTPNNDVKSEESAPPTAVSLQYSITTCSTVEKTSGLNADFQVSS